MANKFYICQPWLPRLLIILDALKDDCSIKCHDYVDSDVDNADNAVADNGVIALQNQHTSFKHSHKTQSY